MAGYLWQVFDDLEGKEKHPGEGIRKKKGFNLIHQRQLRIGRIYNNKQ